MLPGARDSRFAGGVGSPEIREGTWHKILFGANAGEKLDENPCKSCLSPANVAIFKDYNEPTFMADKKPATKTEILNNIAEATGLARKDVAGVLDALSEEIKKGVKKSGPGQFTIPGLCKIVVQRKPATKAATRPNPFKPGEMMEVAAKPARNVVKVRPLKNLKDMVA